MRQTDRRVDRDKLSDRGMQGKQADRQADFIADVIPVKMDQKGLKGRPTRSIKK